VAVLLAAFALACASGRIAADGPAREPFDDDALSIISLRCIGCHCAGEAKGGLVLETRAGTLAGGESGPALVPGEPQASLLLERVRKGEMPPRERGKSQRLAAAEVATLEAWIRAGAPWPEGRKLGAAAATSETQAGLDWWSLQPIRRPPVPAFESLPDAARERIAGPIDLFIHEGLAVAGMTPAPEADRRTLIRRLSFDLIGLPPSLEEVEAFAADTAPDAYERLADRLLASPHHGERWGRYWLDLVRFAETNGYERDETKPLAWKYRDWVIGALDSDKPFDRFITEQLAGDELPERSEETVIATGLLRAGTWDDEPNDPLEYQYERLEDLAGVTSAAFIGLTVKCARCHDHKFDPIPQVDYYRWAAAFWAGFIEPRDRGLMGGPSHEELGFAALGWTDRGREVPPLHLLRKGDPRQPGPAVEPGFLSAVPGLDRPPEPPPASSRTTLRRLALARWLTAPENPLTARVIANRLWQHHFGAGLSRTPNNFGFKGDPPSHPRLLDWLASELVEGGFRLKRMHRLIVLSHAYRQASVHPLETEYAAKDAANRLLWRANRRRLDAEALRDALLAAAGELDLRRGGESFRPRISSEALEGLSRKAGAWSPSPPEEERRRSVYIFTKRSLIVPLLTAFDFCDTTQPCEARDVTTAPAQALALLNGESAHAASTAFARRVAAEAGPDARRRIARAFEIAFARAPSAVEMEACFAHLEEQRRHFAARLADEGRSAEKETAAAPESLHGLVLRLRADEGVEVDEHGRVAAWRDLTGRGHDAAQPDRERRPLRVREGAGTAVLRFDGEHRFLRLAGQVLASPTFTIFALASDRAGAGGHRSIFSNWDGAAGNSVTSVFLGLTGAATVRFSDDFSAAGASREPARPFLITAVSGAGSVSVQVNAGEPAVRGAPLSPRRLDTPYVIGQQGNIDGEYWNGDIAELIVFDRELPETERRLVRRHLAARHGLELEEPRADPEALALASLCHVLLNTNEFLHVD
jgi:hypothetical protein